ncbi:MAG TPA: hypothetical protein VMV29_08815 [Ktedonobacterales bacterium]|nr:hypothetical protein [Ktedonobacterales bacterium]
MMLPDTPETPPPLGHLRRQPWRVGEMSAVDLSITGVWRWLVWDERCESWMTARITCTDRETALTLAGVLNARDRTQRSKGDTR